MRNFNTNQTRHFYTNGLTVNGVTTTAAAGTVDGKYVYVGGVNADGLQYRSDLIPIGSKATVVSSDKLALPLLQHSIAINTDEFADGASMSGKVAKLTITVHQVFDYDDSNSRAFTVEHKVGVSETNTVFYKALADAIKKAMPVGDPQYPYFEVSSSADALVLTEAAQKYVRGKLSGEPVHISVAFGLASTSYLDDPSIQWGIDTVSKSAKTVPAAYALADLEYFAFGERGDYYRGNNWPNNVEPTYAINPNSTETYYIVNVEYNYAGNAENIQKSPRLIQVLFTDSSAANALVTAIAG